MCLLLGATGVGKSLLVKRLQTELSGWEGRPGRSSPYAAHGESYWRALIPSQPGKVGTNLTDLMAHRKITIRELGGCMGPIWPSYYGNCRSLLFIVDAANPTQLSASCMQLLGLLSAEPLARAAVLVVFNKIDLPCYMTVEEMKSLIRLPDIIACAKQNITVAEVSARTGTGLTGVLHWLQDTHRTRR